VSQKIFLIVEIGSSSSRMIVPLPPRDDSCCDISCHGKLVSTKTVGVFCVLIAAAALTYCGIPYAQVENVDGTFPTYKANDARYGSWWCGIALFVAGFMGFFVNNRYLNMQ
jgi:hypothetical protein